MKVTQEEARALATTGENITAEQIDSIEQADRRWSTRRMCEEARSPRRSRARSRARYELARMLRSWVGDAMVHRALDEFDAAHRSA